MSTNGSSVAAIQAVAVYESALEVQPGSTRFQEKLARLYGEDPVSYFEKRSKTLGSWIERDPYQPAPYKLLRKVYTEARHADAAWCTCQALHVLGQAEPDEERFFDRMRSEEPAEVSDPASPDEWLLATMPEASEPFLTELFALIQPFVGSGAREATRFLQSVGGPSHRRRALPVRRGVRGQRQRARAVRARTAHVPEPRGAILRLVLGHVPTLAAARSRAFSEDVTPVAAAFLAGRHLAYYLPGLYVRQLLPNTTALKAWLFAAIRPGKTEVPGSARSGGPRARRRHARCPSWRWAPASNNSRTWSRSFSTTARRSI